MMRLLYPAAVSLLSYAVLLGSAGDPKAVASLQAEPALCGTVDGPFGEGKCLTFSFEGEVSSGQDFDRPLGGNLRFRLNSKPALSGWQIEIIPDQSADTSYTEYVGVVTPPYHFNNPRYLDTSYGASAKEAVQWSPRDFNFVMNEHQYKEASDLVEMAIMSHPQSDRRSNEEIQKESDAAIAALFSFPVAKGRLTILDSRVGSPEKSEGAGTIDWIKFKVELRVPCNFALIVDSSKVVVDRSICPYGQGHKAN